MKVKEGQWFVQWREQVIENEKKHYIVQWLGWVIIVQDWNKWLKVKERPLNSTMAGVSKGKGN